MTDSLADSIDLAKVLPQQIWLGIIKQTKAPNNEGLFNSNTYLQDVLLDKQSLSKNKIIAISTGATHSLALDLSLIHI